MSDNLSGRLPDPEAVNKFRPKEGAEEDLRSLLDAPDGVLRKISNGLETIAKVRARKIAAVAFVATSLVLVYLHIQGGEQPNNRAPSNPTVTEANVIDPNCVKQELSLIAPEDITPGARYQAAINCQQSAAQAALKSLNSASDH